MSKETKYYTLILNYGVEGDEWVDVYGSYSRSEVVDVWEEGFKGYTHEYYGDVWRTKHMLVVPTDGSPEALRSVLKSLNDPSMLSSEVKREAVYFQATGHWNALEASKKKAAVEAIFNSLDAEEGGKVHHTVYKPRYQTYILDTVKDYNGDELPTRQAKINYLFKRFNSEKGWQIQRDGKRFAMLEWLSGLALPIACYNGEIIDMAIKFGSIDSNPSEKLQDKVLDGYWAFMANIILGMEKELI